jgi:hypothetical protein
LGTLLTGICYRNSIKDRTFKKKENLLNEERYRESVRQIEDALQKNNDKRSMYEQKYPELAKYRTNSVK